MKHFTVGPVEFYPSTRAVYQKDFTYFRSDEFSELVLHCMQRLAVLLGNTTPQSLVYLTASGSAAMEAVVENCVTPQDRCLVINGGTFGKRFCDLLTHHHKPYDAVTLPWGETLSQVHLNPYEGNTYTMLFVNLHETSTGQLYDIALLRDFCQRHNAMLVVDAISTFLADPFHMQQYGIDATIISSQKGLCLSPGLSFVSFSPRMKEKLTHAQPASLYFSFQEYLQNMERGQTPSTPAVGIVYELHDMLNLIDQHGGLSKRLDSVKQKCLDFRQRAAQLGLCIPPYPLSNMLTPLVFHQVDARDVIRVLKDEFRLFVNPCGGDLADKMLRVGHIGAITKEDGQDLLDKIQQTLTIIKKGE